MHTVRYYPNIYLSLFLVILDSFTHLVVIDMATNKIQIEFKIAPTRDFVAFLFGLCFLMQPTISEFEFDLIYLFCLVMVCEFTCWYGLPFLLVLDYLQPEQAGQIFGHVMS